MLMWHEKRKELETNLGLLQSLNGDVDFDDVKGILQRVLLASEWLSGGNTEELGDVVPLWKNFEGRLEILVSYVKVSLFLCIRRVST